MTRNSDIALAVRRALITSAVAAATSASLPSYAQDQEQADEVTTVTVTGTRIRRQDYEATSPVVTIGTEQLAQAGTVQLETVLNQLPQLVPSLTTTSNNPSANGGAGQALVDLRGLGTTRTLVLLDGQRLMPTYTNGQIDLNQIPAALIENIEILTGGASSVYGSDAIAGVINVVLKKNFEGAQLDAEYGQTSESDGETLAVNLTLGGNFAEERGNMVLSLSYDDRERILQGDRPYSQVAFGPTLLPQGSATIPEGRYDVNLRNLPNPAVVNAVFVGYGAAGGSVLATNPLGFNTDSTLFDIAGTENYRGPQFVGFNPTSFNYNFAPVNYLQLPLTRRQIAGFGNYDVGEWSTGSAEVYSRITFTTYEASQQLAATPISGLSVPANNPNIPADLATILASRTKCSNATQTVAACTGTIVSGANDPFTFRVRTLSSGERVATNNFDVMQSLVGVRGDLGGTDRSWNWDVFASWGRTETTESQLGNISFSRIQGLLRGTDLATCAAADFDPFGLGNMTAECAQAIAIRATNVIEIEQENMVGVLSGPVFEMPAGPFQVAVGAEYRNTTAEFRPDEFLASGDVVGFNAQPPQKGRVGVNELFAELAVPLLKDLPAMHSLDLELGYRYSDYNIAGTVDTYKGALNWKATDDLKFRGSYNRAVRAPSILELFLAPQENFPGYNDPCDAPTGGGVGGRSAQVLALCTAQGVDPINFQQPNPQVRSLQSGNRNVDPESADTYTVGVVWQPEFGNTQLRTAVDYWKYDITDTIDAVSANSSIGRCFNDVTANPTFDPNNVWCQRFTRLSNGEIDGVLEPQENLGKLKADGVDLQIDYAMPLGERFGRLRTNLLLTHIMEWSFQEDDLSPFGFFEGTITTDVAEAFPEWKAVLNLGWDFGKFGVDWNMRYIDGLTVVNDDSIGSPVTVGLANKVDSYDYHRLTAIWRPTDAFNILVGVDNLFNKEPPIYTDDAQAGQQANTDPSTYDILGRRYYMSATYKF